MGTKMKGFYKGFKFITQIFVVKEREMEIGYPTDVKHVAHIGWDGQSGSAPSWMKEFKTTSDFAATSITNVGVPSDPNSILVSTWSAQDYEQPMTRRQTSAGICRGSPTADYPRAKKHKRKKIKSEASSPKSSASMSRPSRASTKPKPSLTVMEM
ncbi:hypothetical protein Scep_013043 [Stephania cephalantha]|uniref:CRIB domain-containing protein n=1 Tax=Stephania cephalantha TaxID=152367 RepID=A0AAP0JIC1_9MAGN